MVTSNDYRRADSSFTYRQVERQPRFVAFPVAEPADAAGQALEWYFGAGPSYPIDECRVVRKEVADNPVSLNDVFGVAGERGPAERTLALAEERTDIGGDEAGVFPGGEGSRDQGIKGSSGRSPDLRLRQEAAFDCFAPQIVAVIKGDCAH